MVLQIECRFNFSQPRPAGYARLLPVPFIVQCAHWPIRRLILGFCRSKISQNGRFPALDADEPPCKNLTPLALSVAEKSVTVQTQKNTQTNNKLIYPHLAHWHAWITTANSIKQWIEVKAPTPMAPSFLDYCHTLDGRVIMLCLHRLHCWHYHASVWLNCMIHFMSCATLHCILFVADCR